MGEGGGGGGSGGYRPPSRRLENESGELKKRLARKEVGGQESETMRPRKRLWDGEVGFICR